jgi:hypothetical protein
MSCNSFRLKTQSKWLALKQHLRALLCCLMLCMVFLLLQTLYGAADSMDNSPPRLANGVVIYGTVEDVNDEGIAIKDVKGVTIYPWKHLSAGTRYRYGQILQEKKANVAKQQEKKEVKKGDNVSPATSTNAASSK